MQILFINIVSGVVVRGGRACSSSHHPRKPAARHGTMEEMAQMMPQKVSVSIVNHEVTDMVQIDSYSTLGFLLTTGLRIIGPLAAFPKGILSWRVGGGPDCGQLITPESLTLFTLLEPKLDVLVIGVGDVGNTLPPETLRFLKSRGIGLEVLPTEAACPTFNFLNLERRCVAGAFIPPSEIVGEVREDDNVIRPLDRTVMKPDRSRVSMEEWDEMEALVRDVKIRRLARASDQRAQGAQRAAGDRIGGAASGAAPLDTDSQRLGRLGTAGEEEEKKKD